MIAAAGAFQDNHDVPLLGSMASVLLWDVVCFEAGIFCSQISEGSMALQCSALVILREIS
jgi:hypothetical protein